MKRLNVFSTMFVGAWAILLIYAGTLCAAGKFTIDGEKIIDPNGKQFIALGTNINGYQTNWRDENRTKGDLTLFKHVWKFNFARLYCRLYKSSSNQLGGLDQFYDIVDTYIKAKIVVMLTFHDHTGGLYTGSDLDDLIKFNVAVINRFKSHPDFTYLWFETMNEPGDKPLNDIDAMNRKFLQGIRDAGATDNIYCAPGNYWSQEGTNFSTALVPATTSYILTKGKAIQDWNNEKWGNRNVIFSPHFYRVWIHGDAKMKDFIEKCYAQKLPLICGEYGVQTPGGSTVEATKSMGKVAFPLKVGRCVWHWTGGDDNKLVGGTGRSGRDINKTDGTKPTNLTWLGGFVWDDNYSNAVAVAAGRENFRSILAANGSLSSVKLIPTSGIDLRGAALPFKKHAGNEGFSAAQGVHIAVDRPNAVLELNR